jgi:glycosyltransferase involved in cell wall biosynthesis
VQGVFAEIAETEPDPYRGALLVQAEAERENLRTARAIVTPSDYAAACIERHYRIDQSGIDVIPHGFRLDEWRKHLDLVDRQERSHPVILTVAGLYPRKGIDTILRAAALLGDADQGPQVHIVGDGFDRGRLDALVRELGIVERVRFESDLSARAPLASRYANADLFCLPSRHETFGFVFLEAMAAGLPVVAADAGAAPEVLGEAGILVPAGEPEATAEAIRDLLSQSNVRNKVTRKGLQRVAAFTWERAAEAYLGVLDRVCR